MRVPFRFGDAQVGDAIFGEHRGERARRRGRREYDRCVDRTVVLSESGEAQVLNPLPIEVVEIQTGESPSQLPGAVRAQVEKYHRIAALRRGQGGAVFSCDYHRL